MAQHLRENLQGTQVLFPAPTTVLNSNSKKSNTFFWPPQTPGIYMVHRHIHAGKTLVHKKLNLIFFLFLNFKRRFHSHLPGYPSTFYYWPKAGDTVGAGACPRLWTKDQKAVLSIRLGWHGSTQSPVAGHGAGCGDDSQHVQQHLPPEVCASPPQGSRADQSWVCVPGLMCP